MGKKNKVLKSEDVRAREAEMIRSQLDDLGFPDSEEIQAVHEALHVFVRDGTGVTHAWKMREFGVTIILLLSTQPHITSYAKITRSN